MTTAIVFSPLSACANEGKEPTVNPKPPIDTPDKPTPENPTPENPTKPGDNDKDDKDYEKQFANATADFMEFVELLENEQNFKYQVEKTTQQI